MFHRTNVFHPLYGISIRFQNVINKILSWISWRYNWLQINLFCLYIVRSSNTIALVQKFTWRYQLHCWWESSPQRRGHAELQYAEQYSSHYPWSLLWNLLCTYITWTIIHYHNQMSQQTMMNQRLRPQIEAMYCSHVQCRATIFVLLPTTKNVQWNL